MSKNNVQLYSRFECHKTSQELIPLIRSASNLIKEKNGKLSATPAYIFDDHLNLLYSHLFEKTDLEKRLKNLKASKLSIKIFDVLYHLQKEKDENLLNSMLNSLSKELKNIKQKSPENYRIICLTNIKKFSHTDFFEGRKKEFQIYKNILNIFDIKPIHPNDFKNNLENIDKTNEKRIIALLNYFNSASSEIIEINIKGRDLKYIYEKINQKLDLLFGFLAFIKCSFWRFSSMGNEPIYNLDILSHFVLNAQDNLISPRNTFNVRHEINSNKPRWMLELKISENYDKYQHYIKFIDENKDKKSLWKHLNNFLQLYQKACNENSLDYSFLRFWMINESIIKKINGKTKDIELKRTMIKILSTFFEWPVEKFIEKRIDFLHDKRNLLVHEGNNQIINEEDRNLAKLIADTLLFFFIENYPKLNNLEEYKFYLQNSNKTPQ